MTDTRTRRHPATYLAVATVAGLVASGALIWQGSQAAFTAQTDNGVNNWDSGKVVLSDNDGGTALFNATGLTPGDTGFRCINVEYDGDVAADVELYVSASAGTLAPYINLTVDAGTGATDAACTGFTPLAPVSTFTGTLASFASTHDSYANGFGTWAPSASGLGAQLPVHVHAPGQRPGPGQVSHRDAPLGGSQLLSCEHPGSLTALTAPTREPSAVSGLAV